MGTAVEIEGVSKRFRLYREKPHSLKERVIHAGRTSYDEFWALNDVSIHVQEGETLGVLGHNGSGKSTLLKCVAGTLRPTSGSIRTRGRVAALLELGAGFHPDLTGRENVYLNGSILGFSEASITRIFDEIVAFAELEQFIDQQVKHYSSGMYARLAFAVAVNVDPDVLVVDEVLSVGDEAFQRKCLDRMKAFQKQGRTILLVTHAADMVRQFCHRGAVLDRGSLVVVGDPNTAVRQFRDSLRRRGVEVPPEAMETEEERLTKTVRFTAVELEYPGTEPFVRSGEELRIRVRYKASRPVDDCVFAVGVYDQEGNLLLATNTDHLLGGCPVESEGEVVFDLEEVHLLDGKYLISLGIHDHKGVEFDHREQLDDFDVMSEGRMIGRVHFPMHITHTVADAGQEPYAPAKLA